METPKTVSITGVTYLDFGDRYIYAEPLGSKTLVFTFDHQPSLGLIRLGIRKAEKAIEEALYRGFGG